MKQRTMAVFVRFSLHGIALNCYGCTRVNLLDIMLCKELENRSVGCFNARHVTNNYHGKQIHKNFTCFYNHYGVQQRKPSSHFSPFSGSDCTTDTKYSLGMRTIHNQWRVRARSTGQHEIH